MDIIGAVLSGGIKPVFEGIGNLAKDIRQAITGEISPEKKAEIEQRAMEIEFIATKAQTDINLEEAKHPSVFVSGWRPFVGWICGFALGYAAIGDPLLRFVSKVCFNYTGEFPEIDTAITMQALFGLLGLGAYRTFEKTKGVARD